MTKLTAKRVEARNINEENGPKTNEYRAKTRMPRPGVRDVKTPQIKKEEGGAKE